MSQGPRSEKSRRSWSAYRWVMFLAAASLAVYIPYKYATQLHAIRGLYAFLFPLSAVLALGGMALALRPGLALRLPLLARAAVGALAAGWIATGVLCVPTLAKQVMASPWGGLFATFHMLVQHVVLSLLVAALALAPRALFRQMGLELPARERVPEPAASPALTEG